VDGRGVLVAAAAVCAVIALGAVGAPGGGTGDGSDRADRTERADRLLDRGSPPSTSDPTPSWPEAQPDSSWRSVALTDDMWQRALAATGTDSGWSPLVSTRVPDGRQVVVLLADRSAGDVLTVVTATFASDRPGARVLAGTRGVYRSLSSMVAQPARVGAGGVLVVLLPGDIGDSVTVTNSRPGERLPDTTAFVEDRLALVPIVAPEAVTRVVVQRAGRVVLDTVPAGMLLGDDVPRTLDTVATSNGAFPQPVQVRTDGRTVCRMTAGTWWDGPPYVPWNPFDTACASVDGDLHLLLLAEDGRYSSVAGIAPPAAAEVRLRWRDGARTTVRTTGSGANAFIGPQDGSPRELLLAEALTRDGSVLATAIPSRPSR
jgi:hypothetical protein